VAFAASETRDDTDKKYEDDNAALNATGQAPSSTLVVPEFSASFLLQRSRCILNCDLEGC